MALFLCRQTPRHQEKISRSTVKPAPFIIRLETVDSTSTYIRTHPELWDRQFCAVVAREQTAGRGRFDRTWLSEPDLDLTFSMVYRPSGSVSDLSCVTIIAGLAVYRALKPFCGSGLNLKWPNDIRWENKKIGGILCELLPGPGGPIVIIGIGINVNRTRFPEEIEASAASIKTAAGAGQSVETIFNETVRSLIELLADFRIPLDESLIVEWEETSQSIGSPIRFVLRDREETGVFSSIKTDGSLRLITAQGTVVDGYRGEVLFQDDE